MKGKYVLTDCLSWLSWLCPDLWASWWFGDLRFGLTQIICQCVICSQVTVERWINGFERGLLSSNSVLDDCIGEQRTKWLPAAYVPVPLTPLPCCGLSLSSPPLSFPLTPLPCCGLSLSSSLLSFPRPTRSCLHLIHFYSYSFVFGIIKKKNLTVSFLVL